LQELFEAVREECSRGTWSRGVELARAGAVSGEREAAGEIVLRVAERGGLRAPGVVLHPSQAEWSCDCSSVDDPCVHVAAAVIALRRAREAGDALPRARGAPGRIGYRLAREAGGLALERVVVGDEGEVPLRSTLAAVASGRVDGPPFLATDADVEAERALGSRLRGRLGPETMPRVLAALSAVEDLRLDGTPVRASAEPVLPVARVEDQGDGFRLSVSPDPAVRETFAGAVALVGDTLRPIGASGLTGRERTDLPRGVHFGVDDVPRLVTEVLPELERRLPLEVRTTRLPRTGASRPRVLLDVQRDGEALSVLATLVYGDPPVARVDAGRLVHLGGALPLRDEKAEQRLARELATTLELVPGHRQELRGEEAIRFAGRLDRFRGSVRGSAHQDFFETPPLEPRFRSTDAGFELWFETPEGSGPAQAGDGGGRVRLGAAEVLRAWQSGASLLALPGAGFAPLPADWLARYGARVADLMAARRDDGDVERAALPELARLCHDLGEPPPPAFAGLRALVEASAADDGIPPARLPDDLRAELRSYQRRGVDWLCALRDAGLGALLADDMGLGKTLQALCSVRGRALVVAPTSVLANWADEAARFRPGLRVNRYHGPRRALDAAADLTLTSYAILRLDAEALARTRWDCLVLDEAQNIKNPDSQAARAAFALDAGFRVALTGTPVENRLEELWSELHFALPGLLGSRGSFEQQVARPLAAGEDPDGEVWERFRRRIRPFLLRRTKREVEPELPPRTEVVLRCALGEAERAVYDAVRATTLGEVREKLAAGSGVMQALEALLRLRQAACHPALVPGQAASSPGPSAKLTLLQESLEEICAEEHKALVFSQWTGLLDLAEPVLREAGLDFLRLDGSTRDRGGVVARFQDLSGPPVMLISLRAGGTGLNLTAADHVFLLDPWWNPAVEDQAADRAHRIGQDRPVLISRLVAEDTVEERILALQERKRALAEAAIGGPGAAPTLTRDDLLQLLEDEAAAPGAARRGPADPPEEEP